MKLKSATLADLPVGVLKPTYDRSALTAGIVHIGVGNFHRAHQAWYLHRLMQLGHGLDWAIIGAGVRPPDGRMREKLFAQDWLTTLIELDPAGQKTEVLGSMIDFLPVEDTNSRLIAAMSDPGIRIVSLTVTEGGYYYDPSTGKLDVTHRDILHDASHPGSPRTAFGAMVAALKARRDAGHPPFTGQSCDNLQGNGDILREVICTLARLSDPTLADWINANGAFPNSMVDCIVPATGPAELELAAEIGIDDAAPVTHESFRQWVIEDDFCNGRPEWETVGATLTNSVQDFELMKLRLLNAGHQVLANAGELMGLETIADCMAHPLLSKFFGKVMCEEIAPLVKSAPGLTTDEYVAQVKLRFSNPRIYDTTRRVAFDGSSRHPGFVIPSIRDARDRDAPIEGLALVEAIWARMCAAVRENGSLIEPNDPRWNELHKRATEAQTDPTAWLEVEQVYGGLRNDAVFTETFVRWMNLLQTEGLERALKSYLETETSSRV